MERTSLSRLGHPGRPFRPHILHDIFSLLQVFLAALLAAVLILFAVLLLQRAAVNFLTRRAKRREADLTPLLQAALTDPSAVPRLVRAVGRSDLPTVREMILHLALDLKGSEVQALAGLYRTLGLMECDLAALRASRWKPRAAAAARLGTLRSPDILPPLLGAVADPAMDVRLIAVRSVAETNDRAALASLVLLLGDASPGVVRAAVEVLSLRGREVIANVLAFLQSAGTSTARQAAVDVLGYLRAPQAADALLDLIGEPDIDLRIKAVKAAAAIGDPQFRDIFEDLLQDPHWEVRYSAAKGLTLLGSPESICCLREALKDTHSWVRLYAAQALVGLGPSGCSALRHAAEDGNSPACDIARYLLERAELAPVVP